MTLHNYAVNSYVFDHVITFTNIINQCTAINLMNHIHTYER